MRLLKRLASLLLVLVLAASVAVADGLAGWDMDLHQQILDAEPLDPYGLYYSELEVATYLYQYGMLPMNYITKDDAEELGWTGGSVEYYLADAAIGGDIYRNLSKVLPTGRNIVYHECDIDTNGKQPRGAKRIIYSEAGCIYYTEDHYTTFVQLIGEEDNPCVLN